MPETSYDCVVIGSGPGGYVAAIRAAQLGMKTAVIEKDEVGGRCLNYACIPAKAVLRVADVLSEIREADDYGIKVSEPEVDFAGVTARRLKVVKTLTGGVSGLFKKNGIEVIEGEGALAGPGAVTVNGNRIEAKTIILATGSVKKPIPGTQFGGRVIGTEEAWALEEPPQDPRGRGRRRVGVRDRLGLRAPGDGHASLRGARSRAPDRGRGHLEGRRARPQAPGHLGPHGHVRREHREHRVDVQVHARRRAARGRVAGDRDRPRSGRSRPWASTRPASPSTATPA